MKSNKGITMVELILVMALIFIVLPFAWDYINSSVEDSATLNNKMMVQNSVNALMNQIQRDIQEARCPISPDNAYNNINTGFLICKPGTTSVLYTFVEDAKRVKCEDNLKISYPPVNNGGYSINYEETSETNVGMYDYIKEITLERVNDKDGINNGVKVYIRGQFGDDERSGYTMTNTYYTRNTMF